MQTNSINTIASRSLLAILFVAGLGTLGACGGGDDGDSGDGGNGGFVSITEVSPDHGTQLGGNVVIVSGNGFTRAGVERNQLLVGDTLAEAVSVLSDTTIEVIMPASEAAGPVGITVFNGNGSASLGDVYSYNEKPTITSVSPEDSDYRGGETITVTGTGFQNLEAGENSVLFGDVPGTDVSVVDDGTITVVAPPGRLIGDTDVEVENDNGRSNPGAFAFVGSGILAFGHSRRSGVPFVDTVLATDGEIYQIDPISKTIESTGQRVTVADDVGVPICRGVTHDGETVIAQTHGGAIVEFSFEDQTANTISSLAGCNRVHALALHQGDLYGYCRDNPNGQRFGRIDTAESTFTPIGDVNECCRMNLVSDGTTLYLKTNDRISTINPLSGILGPSITITGDGDAIKGMAFVDGVLYGVSSSLTGGGNEQLFLLTLDPNTGETDFVMTLGTGVRGLVSAR